MLRQVLLKQGVAAGCERQSPSRNEPCWGFLAVELACAGALPCCRALPRRGPAAAPALPHLLSPHHILLHCPAQPWPWPSRGGTPHTSQSLPPQGSLTKLCQPQKDSDAEEHPAGWGGVVTAGGSVVAVFSQRWPGGHTPCQGAPSSPCLAVARRLVCPSVAVNGFS